MTKITSYAEAMRENPPTKVARQGLITTIKELRELADKRELELMKQVLSKEVCKKTNLIIWDIEIQINIINKEGLSDTWSFEK